MANTNEESLDEEKFLFAVDMVNYFLNKKHPNLVSEFTTSDVCQKADSCRIRVRNRFSENIKKVLEVIDETQSVLVRRDFIEIKDQDRINESSLMEYNNMYKDCHFDKGFQSGNFLMYCARSAAMACFFFAHGRKDCLRIAVDLIQSAFPKDKDECKSIWDSLDNAALKYAGATKSDLPGDSASYIFRREPSDLISSETEESSSSSTINSESDSVVEMQNVTSASSAESLTAAVKKLNVSSMECTDYPESAESSTTTEDPDVQVANTSEPSSSSSSSIPSVLLSNIEESIKSAFWKIEGESSSKNIPVKSPSKSCLGKRPSPRKSYDSELRGTSSVKASGSADDSETQIKKPKLSLPDTSDEHE